MDDETQGAGGLHEAGAHAAAEAAGTAGSGTAERTTASAKTDMTDDESKTAGAQTGRTAGKAPRRAASGRAAGKKASAEKAAPAKKTAATDTEETPAKAKAAPAKKTAAKKAASKKAAPKKTASAKPAPRRAAPAKAAVKKAPAKKTAVKKTTPASAPAKKAAAPRPAARKTAPPRKASGNAPEKASAAERRTAAQPAPQKAPQPAPDLPQPAPQDSQAAQRRAAGYGDIARFAETVADVNARTQSLFTEVANKAASRAVKAPEPPEADPLNVSEAAGEVAAALAANPAALASMQMSWWTDYARLFAATAERLAGHEADPVAAPAAGDKRFAHPAWEDNPLLDFVKQSYLLASRWVDKAIDEAEGVDWTTRRKARFHADQIMAALSPSNVPALNPVVVDETLASKGENWNRGIRNFLEDLERGKGELAIKQADLDYFEVGRNVATTPGKVVYQNPMMQLIQYAPTTEEVALRPLVVFPPWINKFYILDLQPENSFIKWAVDQGRTVFVVSWVNPDATLKDRGFEDYMREGVFAALDAVEKATGVNEIDAIGYCIGGTLLAVTLAYMQKIGDERIKTATFFTAQTDFSEAGDLSVFVDDKQLAALERQIDAAGGVLEGSAMARTFNMLRPNDLIWQAFVDNYYLGKEAKKFDLLYWNADATRMTKASHSYYLRNFYRHNRLAEGTLEIAGEKVSLGTIKIPAFFQAGEKDHIAPPRSVYKSAKLFGGNALFMLAGSGHIAGVVNPPAKKKYHYRTNQALPETMEEWTRTSELHDYSWWPYWDRWLTERSPGRAKARIPGEGGLPAIEDAPGSYVKVRSD